MRPSHNASKFSRNSTSKGRVWSQLLQTIMFSQLYRQPAGVSLALPLKPTLSPLRSVKIADF